MWSRREKKRESRQLPEKSARLDSPRHKRQDIEQGAITRSPPFTGPCRENPRSYGPLGRQALVEGGWSAIRKLPLKTSQLLPNHQSRLLTRVAQNRPKIMSQTTPMRSLRRAISDEGQPSRLLNEAS